MNKVAFPAYWNSENEKKETAVKRIDLLKIVSSYIIAQEHIGKVGDSMVGKNQT